MLIAKAESTMMPCTPSVAKSLNQGATATLCASAKSTKTTRDNAIVAAHHVMPSALGKTYHALASLEEVRMPLRMERYPDTAATSLISCKQSMTAKPNPDMARPQLKTGDCTDQRDPPDYGK